jgi:bacterioferritin-associated ferredoxin
MLVCHCQAVSDRRIRESVRSGARSCREVERATGAGSGCGGCSEAVAEIVARESQSLPGSDEPLPPRSSAA